jgi:hypothetical protein
VSLLYLVLNYTSFMQETITISQENKYSRFGSPHLSSHSGTSIRLRSLPSLKMNWKTFGPGVRGKEMFISPSMNHTLLKISQILKLTNKWESFSNILTIITRSSKQLSLLPQWLTGCPRSVGTSPCLASWTWYYSYIMSIVSRKI